MPILEENAIFSAAILNRGLIFSVQIPLIYVIFLSVGLSGQATKGRNVEIDKQAVSVIFKKKLKKLIL